MNKSLYERVILEPIAVKEEDKKVPELQGIGEDKVTPVRVKIISWGTMPDGSPFPFEDGIIAYASNGATMTPLGDGRFLVDRRLILGIE